MDPRETRFEDCVIVRREGGPLRTAPLFEWSPAHGMQCRLEGYAIVPREQYEALVEKADKWDALPTPDVPWVAPRQFVPLNRETPPTVEECFNRRDNDRVFR